MTIMANEYFKLMSCSHADIFVDLCTHFPDLYHVVMYSNVCKIISIYKHSMTVKIIMCRALARNMTVIQNYSLHACSPIPLVRTAIPLLDALQLSVAICVASIVLSLNNYLLSTALQHIQTPNGVTTPTFA